MRESAVEHHFRKRVKERGGHPRKFVSPGHRGVTDQIAIMPAGITIWVELKRPGEEPEPHQVREHQRLRDLDHIVLVLDTKERVDYYFGPECRYANLPQLRKLRA